MNRTQLLALLVGVSLPSCLSVRADEPAAVGASVNATTAYWFRGAPVNTSGALQGDLATSIPLADGGLLDLSTWGNMSLTNDSGNGVEPDGNALGFTEVDFVASYTRSFDGYDVTTGVVSYNFPNLVGGSTTEVFGTASFEAFGLSHALSVYYDFDALDGYYMSYAGGWSTEIDERTTFDAGLMLGAMGGDQAAFYFGTDSNGLSDLSLSGTFSRAIDEATTVSATLAYVTTIDSDYKDALDANGLDDNGIVLTVGAGWSF
ncbi:MAG: hypothetical protein R3F49_12920 [Planctomycetota bacterium]